MKATTLRAITRTLPIPGSKVMKFVNLLRPYVAEVEEPLVTNAWWGLRFEISNIWELIQKSIFFTGYYELRESLLIRRILRRGDVFVDIGANMGWFTVLAAQSIGDEGHVYAFEPAKKLCQRLRSSVALNGMTNVSIAAVALSDTNGTAFLHAGEEGNSGVGSLLGARGARAQDEGEVVQTVVFDKYWGREIRRRIKLAKIDVEGFEPNVLRGMNEVLRSGSCLNVIVEINDDMLRRGGSSGQQVIELLYAHGYELFEINLFGLSPLKPGKSLRFANLYARLRPK